MDIGDETAAGELPGVSSAFWQFSHWFSQVPSEQVGCTRVADHTPSAQFTRCVVRNVLHDPPGSCAAQQKYRTAAVSCAVADVVLLPTALMSCGNENCAEALAGPQGVTHCQAFISSAQFGATVLRSHVSSQLHRRLNRKLGLPSLSGEHLESSVQEVPK
mmetsp:Transcript_3545/g.4151  ORF Transcript_3545/g.4151 Transcript_3545/m.4151 type:complete len:160 (-) Transcript_3545:1295-1774(-)